MSGPSTNPPDAEALAAALEECARIDAEHRERLGRNLAERVAAVLVLRERHARREAYRARQQRLRAQRSNAINPPKRR